MIPANCGKKKNFMNLKKPVFSFWLTDLIDLIGKNRFLKKPKKPTADQ